MVQEVELVGHLGRAPVVGRQQQLERGVRAAKAARRVEARAESKAHGPLVHLAGVELGDAHQGAQAGALGACERTQPLAREPPVLTSQRHQVAHRGEPHEVELALRLGRIAAGAGPQRLGELVRHPGGAEARERVGLERGVQHRAVGQAMARAVMVGDHHVDSPRTRGVHLARWR